MRFQDLGISEEVIRALTKLHYQKPLPIQEMTIPHLLAKEDVVIRSQTGSGKSAAFLIPTIQTIDWDLGKVQTLVIAPTRELSLQLIEEADAIGLYRRIRSVLLNGKAKYEPQIQRLKRAHLAIGTPGRIRDHIERGTLDLSALRYLVLDEADVLLDMGFLALIQQIMEKVPESCTIALCSATIDESLEELIHTYLHDPRMLSNEMREMQLKQFVCPLKESDKFTVLCNYAIEKQAESIIVFCNRRESVEQLYRKMCAHQISAVHVHGGLLQKERYEAIEAFRKGHYRFLIASDVAGRGLDIADVQLVVQYELSDDLRKYIHRIGRSARLDQAGESLVLLSDQQQNIWEAILPTLTKQPQLLSAAHYLREINGAALSAPDTKKQKKSELVRNDVVTLYLHGGKDKKIRIGDIVGVLCQKAALQAEDIGVIEVRQHGSYVEILNGKGTEAYHALQNTTIKKKKIRVFYAQKSKNER